MGPPGSRSQPPLAQILTNLSDVAQACNTPASPRLPVPERSRHVPYLLGERQDLIREVEELDVPARRGTSTLLSGVVDLILGAALLAGVPRLRMSARRLLPSAGEAEPSSIAMP